MRTQDFISRLREAPAKRLVFTNLNGATIHGGYHLTELKAASFDTVDCGAQKNQWNDTIARLISLDVTSEIRFEYGDKNFPPSDYHVEKISENEAELRVQLRLPQTTCKARDRCQSGEACCG